MKNFIKHFALFLFIGIISTSCLKEDHFGESSSAIIKEISIIGQDSDAEIDPDNNTVTVSISRLITKGVILKLETSSFASSSKNTGDTIDFKGDNTIQVTAEDGTLVIWEIIAVNP